MRRLPQRGHALRAGRRRRKQADLQVRPPRDADDPAADLGDRLASGNMAVALLGNTLATGAALIVLILIFGPISGAHFNPAVTLGVWLRGKCESKDVVPYMIAQLAGGVLAWVWACG